MNNACSVGSVNFYSNYECETTECIPDKFLIGSGFFFFFGENIFRLVRYIAIINHVEPSSSSKFTQLCRCRFRYSHWSVLWWIFSLERAFQIFLSTNQRVVNTSCLIQSKLFQKTACGYIYSFDESGTFVGTCVILHVAARKCVMVSKYSKYKVILLDLKSN